MSKPICTPAPPPPPGGPSDWTATVHGNCFSNIDRLGLWKGGTTLVPHKTDPSSFFDGVPPGALGGGGIPGSIYVVTHGWAPGYRSAVKAQGGNLLWWGSNAAVDGVWASDWAWSPVSVTSTGFQVNPTGVLQQIVTLDSKAVVLAYSWIDDSATDSGDLNLDEVYESEAYTHVNGIRLANALEQAIFPTFWERGGVLRLMGHSHGSKVMTVAALTLQNRGRSVAHLTILDSPESDLTLDANAANLLGFYLEQMQIADPSSSSAGTFVDNYASYFGVGYRGTHSLKNDIVEVGLDPSELYDLDQVSDKHTYAAAWYGGAAAGAASQDEPPLGLAWPPPPDFFLPALNQNWPGGASQFAQWNLQPGPLNQDTFTYSTQPMAVTTSFMQGVSGDPSTRLIFAPGAPRYSIFQGTYDNSQNSDAWGIAFDVVWIAPKIGDYMVVTMESTICGREVLLVMDGQSNAGGKTSVAITSAASSFICTTSMYIYFLAAAATPALVNVLAVSNFRFINVGSASGVLRARREAAINERLQKRALKTPRA